MSKARKFSAQSSMLAASFVAGEVAVPASSAPPEAEAVPEPVASDSPDDRPISRPASQAAPPQGHCASHAVALALGGALAEPSAPSAGEQEVLFDAWHASFSEQLTLPLARKHLQGSSGYLRLFADKDDRNALRDGTKWPWHSICSLVITGAGGTRWAGTGWLAGPRTVVTAGHCLYLHGRSGAGQWADQVEVRFPNVSRFAEPIRATELISVSGWIVGRKTVADYGAVLLPADATPLAAMPIPYAVVGDADIGSEYAIVAGFCTDKQPRTLWGFARTIREPQPRQLLFNHSVFGGLSGGPVLMQVGSVWTVVGMQQDGDFAATVAVRISSAVSRNIDSWVGREGS